MNTDVLLELTTWVNTAEPDSVELLVDDYRVQDGQNDHFLSSEHLFYL